MLTSKKPRAKSTIPEADAEIQISMAMRLRGGNLNQKAEPLLVSGTRAIKPVRFHLLKHVVQLILPSLLSNLLDESILLVTNHFCIPLTSAWAQTASSFGTNAVFRYTRRRGRWGWPEGRSRRASGAGASVGAQGNTFPCHRGVRPSSAEPGGHGRTPRASAAGDPPSLPPATRRVTHLSGFP